MASAAMSKISNRCSVNRHARTLWELAEEGKQLVRDRALQTWLSIAI